MDFVNRLLALGVDVNSRCNQNTDIIRTLIAFDDDINVTNEEKQTLLMVAPIYYTDNIIKYLIPISNINATDVKGNTPLIYAVKYNKTCVTDLLAAGADKLIMNNKEKTALKTLMESLRVCK